MESRFQSFIDDIKLSSDLLVLLNVITWLTVSPGWPLKNSLEGETEMPCACAKLIGAIKNSIQLIAKLFMILYNCVAV